MRGGKEEPDGGIRRPACERGDVMGYSCPPSCPGEGEDAGQGHLVHSQFVATLGLGADF